MTPDGLPPDAAAHDTLRPGRRTWRRDVIEGVTRRFAMATLPALVLALIAARSGANGCWPPSRGRTARDGDSPAHCLSPRARVALIVGVFVWTNGFVMVYGREIPFDGMLMPMAASFAALMGGPRWGWWTLAVTSATWLLPWACWSPGAAADVEIPWPSQYFRLWFLHTSLTAGLVATITHVTRDLEAAMDHGERCSSGCASEARAVQALAGRVREAEEGERRRLARELHDDFGQRLTALRMKLKLSQPQARPAPGAMDECMAISEELLRDVRAFARGLRPPLLDEVGLGPALRALIDAHVDRSAFVVTLDVPERLPAPAAIDRAGRLPRRAGGARQRAAPRGRDAGCRWRPATTAAMWSSG